jgi:hypothetical protein
MTNSRIRWVEVLWHILSQCHNICVDRRAALTKNFSMTDLKANNCARTLKYKYWSLHHDFREPCYSGSVNMKSALYRCVYKRPSKPL